MKANELMIGDYVTFADCQNDKYPSIIKIWQINEDGESFASIDGGKAVDEITIDDEIVGIPITPKILKKNGFGYIEKTEDITHYYLRNRNSCRLGLHIGTNNKGDYWVNTNYNDIYGLKYVHELQHAFRLFKLEKDIVL